MLQCPDFSADVRLCVRFRCELVDLLNLLEIDIDDIKANYDHLTYCLQQWSYFHCYPVFLHVIMCCTYLFQ